MGKFLDAALAHDAKKKADVAAAKQKKKAAKRKRKGEVFF